MKNLGVLIFSGLLFVCLSISLGNAQTGSFSATGSNAINSTSQSKLSDSVSVLDFEDGINSGSVNAVTAITRAMTVSSSIFFPAGTYRLDTCVSVPSSKTLWAIPGTVTLQISATVDLSRCPTISGVKAVIYNAGWATGSDSNIVFNGIAIRGAGFAQTQVTQVVFVDIPRFKFVNGEITNFGNNAFYNQGMVAFGLKYFEITDSVFSKNSGDGIGCDSCTDGVFNDNSLRSNGDYGVVWVRSSRISVASNKAVSNAGGAGIGIDCSTDMTVTGNTTIANKWGIYVVNVVGGSVRITIIGNTGYENNAAGIIVEHPSTNIAITDNVISDSQTGIYSVGIQQGTIVRNIIAVPPGGVGIMVEAFAGQTSVGNVVTNNHINGGAYGIREIASGGTIAINIFANNYTESASIANVSTRNTPIGGQ